MRKDVKIVMLHKRHIFSYFQRIANQYLLIADIFLEWYLNKFKSNKINVVFATDNVPFHYTGR